MYGIFLDKNTTLGIKKIQLMLDLWFVLSIFAVRYLYALNIRCIEKCHINTAMLNTKPLNPSISDFTHRYNWSFSLYLKSETYRHSAFAEFIKIIAVKTVFFITFCCVAAEIAMRYLKCLI